MFTKKEKITIESYDRLATEWVADHIQVDIFNYAFPIFRKYLAKGNLLEIGAGGGRDAKKLADAGFKYIGIDVSNNLLKEARKNNPKLKFLLTDISDFKSHDLFDGFWCAATLLHIPKSKIVKTLKNIHDFIKPGGIGFICIKEGVGDLVKDKRLVDGKLFERYFTYYKQNEFLAILKKCGFSILETSSQPVSKKTTWLNFFVKVEK